MSVHVRLTIDTGGEEWATIADMPSIFGQGISLLSAVGVDVYMMEGGRAGNWATLLERGQAALDADPERFLLLFPDGGRVAFQEVQRWLAELLAHCQKNPDCALAVT